MRFLTVCLRLRHLVKRDTWAAGIGGTREQDRVLG